MCGATVVLPVLLLAAMPAFSQTTPAPDSAHYRGQAGLVYGNHYAFLVRAPAAWTLDSRSGRRQGLQIVLYPAGESWSRSPSVMYCLVTPKGKSVGNAQALIEQETDRFRNQMPEATVVEAPSIRIDDSTVAAVRHFSGGRNHAFEATAYIEDHGIIVSLILSCRTQEAFAGAQPAFANLVRSYRFLTDDAENILRALEAAERDEMQQAH